MYIPLHFIGPFYRNFFLGILLHTAAVPEPYQRSLSISKGAGHLFKKWSWYILEYLEGCFCG